MPRFQSTNRDLPGGFRPTVSFREALFMGQAPDLGLFMPVELPRLDRQGLFGLKGRPFKEAARYIARAFLGDEIDPAILDPLIDDAYGFPVPLEAADARTWVMRLDQGPTASFKDFAARLLARLVAALKPPEEKMTVLVATSGDTGSAVGQAFKGLPGIRVFILYPEREVSPNQKRQLDAIGGSVSALSIDGTFDECQALVKRAFSDPELSKLGLSSANSINFGRILPQSFYYFWSWAQISDSADEDVVFSVPSGNFGNAFACEMARRMGLPVKKLILATNANDEFPRFLDGGAYAPVRPSKACISNAMNVGHPSNLARFFEAFGGTVDKDGKVSREPDREAMRRGLWSTSVSDEDTTETMRRVWNGRRILLEPHGAVGWTGLERYRAETNDDSKAVVLETAHPAKFPEAIRDVLGFEPDAPESLRHLKDGSATGLPASYDALKKHLLSEA